MKMRHPDIDGEAPAAVTTEEAFEEVWSGLGWVAEPEDQTTAIPLNPLSNQLKTGDDS